MKFESACRIAMDYFKKEYDDVGLCSIQDLGEKMAVRRGRCRTVSHIRETGGNYRQKNR